MMITTVSRCLGGAIAAALLAFTALADAAPTSLPANAELTSKPRLIVLTDIGDDPDDAQSIVRLLLYANVLDIDGLIATTSNGLRDAVHPERLEERVRAYGEVLPNLRLHADGYPDAELLLKQIRSGRAVYGMSGVGDGKDSEASKLIIAAVDRPDPRPVWITIWGGAKDLAQALWTVRATRKPAAVAKFVAKLRVYSISDQDDAGPWARANFPQLFWIASVHGFIEYGLSTWNGISDNVPGADPMPVSKPWLDENIRSKGPLGALYPRPVFIMEGDTPSFLYLIANGLGSPEHPDWGSWGGRYGQLSSSLGLWTDVQDSVRGVDGKLYTNNKATVWRWRNAFQNDFSARMDWSVNAKFESANHPPQLVLNGVAGDAPLELSACGDQPVHLSAEGSTDPDGQPLTFRWWRYREPTGLFVLNARIDNDTGPETTVTVPAIKRAPKTPLPAMLTVHVILEATDNGTPALTRYRRAVISIPSPTAPAAMLSKCSGAP